MCNFEALEAIREQVEKLVAHTGELRNRFNDLEIEFQEGNLDADALNMVNEAVHMMETDAGVFEKLLEA